MGNCNWCNRHMSSRTGFCSDKCRSEEKAERKRKEDARTPFEKKIRFVFSMVIILGLVAFFMGFNLLKWLGLI
jgi:hypothetical protein